MLDKNAIINLLDDIADLMEFAGENPFKIRAYRNGANAIRQTDEDIIELIKNNSLDKLKGIGKGLQGIIFEFFDLGESSLYAELKSKVPAGIDSLLKIRGLGVKKLQQLHKELGINTIDDLEEAIALNKLKEAKGFGEASQKKISEEIKHFRANENFVLINKGLAIADAVKAVLSSLNGVKKGELTGDLRRNIETTDKVELVVLCSSKIELFDGLKEKIKVKIDDDRLVIKDIYDVPVYIYLTEKEEEFAPLLYNTTGSNEFIEKTGKAEENAKDEEEIFERKRIKYISPELREKEYFTYKPGESDIETKDFKGLLHFHTVYSDGKNSIDEMVKKGKEAGYEYFAVCDHSVSAIYANGLDEKRLIKQAEEIAKTAKENDVTIFKGIESDILIDGSLDYRDEFLSHFNFIVASIHSRFSLNEEEMTKRIIKAIENEYTDVLGHPTGRLLLKRPAYNVDIKKIIDAAFANKVAIEINANPRRLDLDWRYLYYALEKGCHISINADAHSINEIELTRFGLLTGKKAGLQKKSVINCFTEEEFKVFLNRKVKKV